MIQELPVPLTVIQKMFARADAEGARVRLAQAKIDESVPNFPFWREMMDHLTSFPLGVPGIKVGAVYFDRVYKDRGGVFAVCAHGQTRHWQRVWVYGGGT